MDHYKHLTNVAENVRTMNKKDAVEILLPQKCEDGKLINFRGTVIASYADGEDHEFVTLDRVVGSSRVTDALIGELTAAYGKYFTTAEVNVDEVEEIETELGEEEIDSGELEEPSLKALKKQLKKLEKGTKEHKKLKKQIKKMEK